MQGGVKKLVQFQRRDRTRNTSARVGDKIDTEHFYRSMQIWRRNDCVNIVTRLWCIGSYRTTGQVKCTMKYSVTKKARGASGQEKCFMHLEQMIFFVSFLFSFFRSRRGIDIVDINGSIFSSGAACTIPVLLNVHICSAHDDRWLLRKRPIDRNYMNTQLACDY